MPIAVTDPAQLATPPIRRGKKDGGRRNDRGKERRREGGRGELKKRRRKHPRLQKRWWNRNPNGNCHVLSSTSGFFFFLQGYQLSIFQQLLSPEGGTGAFSWGLQLDVSDKTCLATMAFLRREEERTLLSALTRGPRPEQGVPPNTGCPFTEEHHRLLHLQPWPALPSKPKGRQERGRQRSLLGKLKQRWPPPIISPVLPPNIIVLGRGQAASELQRSQSELKITA